jgi:hypothetical protein
MAGNNKAPPTRTVTLQEFKPQISIRQLRDHKESWREYRINGPRPFLRKTRDYLQRLDGTVNCKFRTTGREQKQVPPIEECYPVLKRITKARGESRYQEPEEVLVNIQGQVSWGLEHKYLSKTRPYNEYGDTVKNPPTVPYIERKQTSSTPHYLEKNKRPYRKPGYRYKLPSTTNSHYEAHTWSPVHFIPKDGDKILKKRRYPLEFPTGLLELPERGIIERIVYEYSGNQVPWWNFNHLTTGEVPGDYEEHTAKRYRLSTTGYYPWLRGVHSEDPPTKGLFEDSDEESTTTTAKPVQVLPVHIKLVPSTQRHGLKTTGLSDEEN